MEGGGVGASSVRPSLRQPYQFYEEAIHRVSGAMLDVLEIGSGTGEFTGAPLRAGMRVVATDISEESLAVVERRHANYSDRLDIRLADMEALPFDDHAFDLVLSAGALSYGDNERVMSEIFRVLRDGGSFICVDSLNHNPIYRANRSLHWLRGRRTRSTLRRMPTVTLIPGYGRKFGSVDVCYFGSIQWMVPFLARIAGELGAARISDRVD